MQYGVFYNKPVCLTAGGGVTVRKLEAGEDADEDEGNANEPPTDQDRYDRARGGWTQWKHGQ